MARQNNDSDCGAFVLQVSKCRDPLRAPSVLRAVNGFLPQLVQPVVDQGVPLCESTETLVSSPSRVGTGSLPLVPV